MTQSASRARDRAEASFKKEERVREGAKAMAEHLAAAKAVDENTARLRALRLAKEAADRTAAAAKPAPVKSKPAAARTKPPAAKKKLVMARKKTLLSPAD